MYLSTAKDNAERALGSAFPGLTDGHSKTTEDNVTEGAEERTAVAARLKEHVVVQRQTHARTQSKDGLDVSRFNNYIKFYNSTADCSVPYLSEADDLSFVVFGAHERGVRRESLKGLLKVARVRHVRHVVVPNINVPVKVAPYVLIDIEKRVREYKANVGGCVPV